MIKSILAPIDGSPNSFSSFKYGLILASKLGASIQALFVIDQRKTQMPFMYAGGAYDMTYERVYIPPDQELRRLYDRLKVDLKQFAERCLKECESLSRKKKIEFYGVIEEGFPAALIEEHAHSVDLVVLGQHGESSGLKKQTAGSTTEEIVRNSPRPVVVCPPGFREPEKVLFPYDGSRGSENALQYYTSNLSSGIPTVIFLCAERERSEEGIFSREISYVRQHGAEVKVIQAPEAPVQAIYSIIEKEKPDLIMLGSHGGHKLVDYLLGSTTIHVIRKSSIPVLVIY